MTQVATWALHVHVPCAVQSMLTFLVFCAVIISGATYWGLPHMVRSGLPDLKSLHSPKSASLMFRAAFAIIRQQQVLQLRSTSNAEHTAWDTLGRSAKQSKGLTAC